MAPRPVHGENAAPVVAHQKDVAQIERSEPGIEVARVILEPIGAMGFTRAAHSDEVGSQATAPRSEAGHDVAPHERRSRISVQKNDGRPGAELAVGDEGVENVDSLSLHALQYGSSHPTRKVMIHDRYTHAW